MRGSVFRDANLVFDVQPIDPGAPQQPHNTGPGTTTSSNFSNGIPVPVNELRYGTSAEGLRTAANDIRKAAQAKDRDGNPAQ